ncbi:MULTISPECIES: hypothetical protein [unclassified Pseudomonas]|uniref:hypothetical protein n=1 Tax=unclassified Pseudomonas TaxID=196821 RepID=UPI0015B460B3|nr:MULTISPECIES: hypothetical protein [unclassified Pseudomonas]
MSKTPDDKVTDPVAPVLSKTTPVADPVRAFRDKVYTSRTLILPGGATLPVAKGRATALDDQQFQYLNSHPDFERLTE